MTFVAVVSAAAGVAARSTAGIAAWGSATDVAARGSTAKVCVGRTTTYVPTRGAASYLTARRTTARITTRGSATNLTVRRSSTNVSTARGSATDVTVRRTSTNIATARRPTRMSTLVNVVTRYRMRVRMSSTTHVRSPPARATATTNIVHRPTARTASACSDNSSSRELPRSRGRRHPRPTVVERRMHIPISERRVFMIAL